MLISTEVEIRMNNKWKKYYNGKGYFPKHGELFIVNIQDLSLSSPKRVDVECDICGVIKTTTYNNYNKSISKGGFYACNQKCSNVKVKLTNIRKYGVPVPSQNIDVLNKMQSTSLQKYGVKNSSVLEESINKVKETKLKIYGNETYNNIEKQKETIKEKYNVNNISQIQEVKNKKIETCLRNYGCEYPTQNKEIFLKAQINSFKLKRYKNYTYRSTYELDFIKLCNSMCIDFIQDIQIKYLYDSKNRLYFADFYIPKYNLICEIKSTYTYNDNLDVNLTKEKYSLLEGYKYLFIFDKNYKEFLNIINPQN